MSVVRLAVPCCAAALLAAPLCAAEPDYGAYQRLLDDYVHVVSRPGEPIETRVDYTGLANARGTPERLARVRRLLSSVPPDSMTATGRLAWAINLYNFRAIELVIQNLMDRSTGKQIGGVKQLPPGTQGFFEQPGLKVQGESYSLDAFERKFVLLGFDRAAGVPRPPGLDPRAHFAVVCASVGCPSLLPRAYRADSLDRQLDFAVRNALASPRHLRWDAARGRLQTNELFQWYRRDFEPDGPLAFIRRHAPADVVRAIEARDLKDLDQSILWDWGLNRWALGAQ